MAALWLCGATHKQIAWMLDIKRATVTAAIHAQLEPHEREQYKRKTSPEDINALVELYKNRIKELEDMHPSKIARELLLNLSNSTDDATESLEKHKASIEQALREMNSSELPPFLR